MAIRKWLSRKEEHGHDLVTRHADHPLLSLQNEINRAFDDFFGISLSPSKLITETAFVPKINVSDSDKEITVTAELPGIEEKDIDVSLTKEVLTIKGEKKTEKEEKEKNYYYLERSSGAFYREIPVPSAVDGDNVKASFKNGVLKVVVPKLPEAQKARKTIPVKAE